jgi:hypothetical protein
MKKNYFKILGGLFLTLFISVQSFAQLGTTTFNTASDNASTTNYPGASWSDGSNGGTGFGVWSFGQGASNAGRYIGGTPQGDPSFGLYSENSSFSYAQRALLSDLKRGESISFDIGVTGINSGGEVFIQLMDNNIPVFTLKFSGGQSSWEINDGGSDFGISQGFSTTLSFSFTYLENGNYSYTFGSANGTDFNPNNTISGIDAIKFQSENQGGGENFGFNNLKIDSKYTINNNSSVNITSPTTAPYLQVESGSTVTVASANALTISGNLTNNGTVTLNSGSSLIVNGTSTGNVTYTRNLPTSNWYLVSSPVLGQAYNDAYVTANGIDSGTGSNRGIATYTTSSNQWAYLQAASDGTFNNGQGYSVKRTTTGDISFTGTINTANVSVAVSNGFNLVGNPFTASLNLGDFFVDNGAAGAISGAQTWFWNGSSYDVKTSGNHGTFEIAPGQGFFVNAAGGGNLTFNISSVSHATAVFQKTNPRPEITLTLTEGSDTRNAYIYYVNGTTIDYDLGYDGNLFGGVSHSLAVYSHLVNNDNGNKYQLQSLPDSNYENMVIPIGIIAAAGKEITFTAEALNLPNDLKVYLEDRLTNTVTRLDEANTSYKVTLNDALNGTGRFFLHTKASGVLSTDELDLSNTSVYATANNTLRVIRLPSGNATVKVFTILGKQVVQTNFSSTGSYDVSLPKLATGMYIVQLETATGKLNKKIFLE